MGLSHIERYGFSLCSNALFHFVALLAVSPFHCILLHGLLERVAYSCAAGSRHKSSDGLHSCPITRCGSRARIVQAPLVPWD